MSYELPKFYSFSADKLSYPEISVYLEQAKVEVLSKWLKALAMYQNKTINEEFIRKCGFSQRDCGNPHFFNLRIIQMVMDM